MEQPKCPQARIGPEISRHQSKELQKRRRLIPRMSGFRVEGNRGQWKGIEWSF